MHPLTFAELGFHAWLTVAVVLGVFVCLLWERFTPGAVLAAAVAVLFAGGVLNISSALAGFTNPAVLTVALVLLVAGALKNTGAIEWVASWVLGQPHGTYRAQARLTTISTVLSAFVNNTPVVAMLTAAVGSWGRAARIPASKLLIPLSYATILGGMCTLIGTSTNLVVLGLMKQHPELPGLTMFDPAWVGVPAALVGVIYLLTVGCKLLPNRQTSTDQARDIQQYTLVMSVVEGGRLDGMHMVDTGLQTLPGVLLVEIQHKQRILLNTNADTLLEGGDQIVFVGTAKKLQALQTMEGLQIVDDADFEIGSRQGRYFVEAVLSRLSPAVGHTLRDFGFRDRYDAVVLAVNRHGRQLLSRPGHLVLQAGDTLLLETVKGFASEYSKSRDFAMVNEIDGVPVVRQGKAALSLGILAAMIAVNTLWQVDIFMSALFAVVALLVTGCLGWRDMHRIMDYSLIVAIACALALGYALYQTGVASAAAGILMQMGGGSPLLTLIIMYVLTMLFTEVLTNNAAAVLMFPVALATARYLGVHAMPFIMTVMMAASASFITPIGYQTNMMVYGPGGYRFTDYVRVGTPLSILVGIVVVIVVPVIWPF